MTEMNRYHQLLNAARATLNASTYEEDVAARRALRAAVEALDAREMKDWPEVLKRNAVAAASAQLNHQAVRAIFGGPAWEDLPADEKLRRVRAETEPQASEQYFQKAVELARAEGARVLARISPQTPWGDQS